MKPLKYILIGIASWLVFTSCEKEEETHLIKFVGAYAYPTYQFDGDYIEIDVNGETNVTGVYPLKGGLESGYIEVPIGWNTINDVRIYNLEGEEVFYVKHISQLGELNGYVASGVPLETRGDMLLQIFKD